jgi:hypothetical protein
MNRFILGMILFFPYKKYIFQYHFKVILIIKRMLQKKGMKKE